MTIAVCVDNHAGGCFVFGEEAQVTQEAVLLAAVIQAAATVILEQAKRLASLIIDVDIDAMKVERGAARTKK